MYKYAPLFFSIALSLGCSQSDTSQPVALASVAQPLTTQATLVSDATCTNQFNRLIRCNIPSQVLSGQDVETAVPLRTVLNVRRSGNCSTSYALEVGLDTPGESTVRLRFLAQPSATVRRRDGGAIAYIDLKDISPWTMSANFGGDCRVWLDIAWNEPDIDSKEQATALIASMDAEVLHKKRIRDRYSDLLNYQSAYKFLGSIASSFHTELTNDTIQRLRGDAQVAKPVLAKLAASENCVGRLSDDEFMSIISLYENMAVLGNPEQWRRPDGTTKTLADVIGSEASAVLAVVEKLSGEHNADAGTGYDGEYRQAAADVAKAEAKLSLARAQLVKWL